MSSFKDILDQDINAVFLNENEFAELFDIDGDTVVASMDSDLLHERNKQSYAEFAEGINQNKVVLFVKKSDLGYVPVKDQVLSINGVRYLVDEVADNIGVLEITLILNTNRGLP